MPTTLPNNGETVFHLLTDTGVYRERTYKNEEELERLVVAHADEIFGKSTLYFDVKQRVATKLHSRVTDGLLLDFRKKPIPHLWVVEYEMYSHDLERHVIPQLRGFVKAFSNEETIATVRDSVYNEINTDAKKQKLFKELTGDKLEPYLTLNKTLHAGDATILLVYDRLPENIDEIFDESDFSYDTRFMEFRTFEGNGKLVHLVNPLLPGEAEAGTGKRQGGFKVEGTHWKKTDLEKEVLKLLAEKKAPLGRKEIIAELENRLTLSEADRQILTTRPRWETYTRFAISDLSLEKGGKLIETHGKNQWVINEKGRKAVKELQ